jgi:hypothetical protein
MAEWRRGSLDRFRERVDARVAISGIKDTFSRARDFAVSPGKPSGLGPGSRGVFDDGSSSNKSGAVRAALEPRSRSLSRAAPRASDSPPRSPCYTHQFPKSINLMDPSARFSDPPPATIGREIVPFPPLCLSLSLSLARSRCVRCATNASRSGCGALNLYSPSPSVRASARKRTRNTRG